MCWLPYLYKNSQGWAIFQWECVDENSKKAKDAKKRKERGEISRVSEMKTKTKNICAISFAYSSALKPRPKKDMEGEKLVNGDLFKK